MQQQFLQIKAKMKNKIEEVEMNGEKVYLKKGLLGWKVVYPNKIDGKINWKHFIAGRSWWNLLWIALIVALIIGCVSEYSIALRTANECLEQLNNFRIILP